MLGGLEGCSCTMNMVMSVEKELAEGMGWAGDGGKGGSRNCRGLGRGQPCFVEMGKGCSLGGKEWGLQDWGTEDGAASGGVRGQGGCRFGGQSWLRHPTPAPPCLPLSSLPVVPVDTWPLVHPPDLLLTFSMLARVGMSTVSSLCILSNRSGFGGEWRGYWEEPAGEITSAHHLGISLITHGPPPPAPSLGRTQSC